jgi:hypothetical protein
MSAEQCDLVRRVEVGGKGLRVISLAPLARNSAPVPAHSDRHQQSRFAQLAFASPF